MKTKVVLTIFLFVVFLPVFSQGRSNAGAIPTLGIKAGINVSGQSVKYDESTSFKVSSSQIFSFHIGFVGDIPISGNLSLQPELLYSREGSEIWLSSEEPNDLDITFKQTVSYINVPVLVSARPFRNKLLFLIGPQLGFLVKDELDIDINDGEIVEPAYKKFQFSAVLGLDFKMISNLHIGARYNLGINDVSDSPDGSLKNNTIQSYLAYTLF